MVIAIRGKGELGASGDHHFGYNPLVARLAPLKGTPHRVPQVACSPGFPCNRRLGDSAEGFGSEARPRLGLRALGAGDRPRRGGVVLQARAPPRSARARRFLGEARGVGRGCETGFGRLRGALSVQGQLLNPHFFGVRKDALLGSCHFRGMCQGVGARKLAVLPASLPEFLHFALYEKTMLVAKEMFGPFRPMHSGSEL